MELKPIVFQKEDSANAGPSYIVLIDDDIIGMVYSKNMMNSSEKFPNIYNFYPASGAGDIICLNSFEFTISPEKTFPDNLKELNESIKQDFKNFQNKFYE